MSDEPCEQALELRLLGGGEDVESATLGLARARFDFAEDAFAGAR
jgi:hypothetical protein